MCRQCVLVRGCRGIFDHCLGILRPLTLVGRIESAVLVDAQRIVVLLHVLLRTTRARLGVLQLGDSDGDSSSSSCKFSATKDYCNQIIKNIFTRDERKKLKVVWSRGKTENKNGFFYVKDVSKMCASQPTFLRRNTVLIDDNPDHAVVSPDNLLRIRPWNSPSQRKDTELRKVLKVLT